jgi:hypothetical protein
MILLFQSPREIPNASYITWAFNFEIGNRMSDPLPQERQDVCKHCGATRTETQGNNGNPRCPIQGCAGQHTR